MKIAIEKHNNGYTLDVEGALKMSGKYVYRNTDEIKMLEDVGELVAEYKVKVERK